MNQLFRIVTIVVILSAGAAQSSAQPSVEAASSQTELEEAKRLNEQVEKLFGEGRYQEAVSSAERALNIRETMLDPRDPAVAESLNNLAVAYEFLAAYAKAEPLYLHALNIREQTLGSNHPDVAESLNNLAMHYQNRGAYTKAESLHLRALAIREKSLGPNHLTVAESLNNLALIYRLKGVYGKAELFYARALGIRETALGVNHAAVAESLSNLAVAYYFQGAYAKAESLSVRALAIRERTLGLDHPLVAYSLNNLAVIYKYEGEYVKAESLYVRALAIREKTLGRNHPDVAFSLSNLAALYRTQGAYARAEPLDLRALEIRERAFGPNHPDVAESLNSLAALYQDQGAYDKAELFRIRVLGINEKVLGPVHPRVATDLNNLAMLYQAQGAYDKARPLLTRAADIDEQQLRTDLIRLPEPRKRALMILLQRNSERVVSFHSDAVPDGTAALELAFTTVLRRKGRILDSMIDGESKIRHNLTLHLRDLLDQLSQARSDLAAHLYAPAGRRDVSARAAADVARARIDEIETRLSAVSAEFRTEAKSVSIEKVRAILPKGSGLVEFTKYRRSDPKQPGASQLREERYVAYLLTSRGAPRWVALGEAAPIDVQIDAVLAAIRDHAPIDVARTALQRLDALVLAPIRAKLPGITRLILAPDGPLNLVPFEALVDPSGHYALENYLISYVTTGRDLLRIAAPRAPRSAAVIVADLAYGPLPPPGPGALSFAPLPDASGEAADLQAFFPSAPVTGENATKANLAALTAPAIIHIATHGFYKRDVPSGRPAPGLLREAARGLYIEGDMPSQSSSTRSDDLADGLDRAGLALAGANQGADGIVTAREIAGFDWWGTQLVVLSACDTGVGAASSGDGVYGMRRALVLAGAASQVVSLWAAEDTATRLLMREFYGNLAHGVGRAEGLRRAKLTLLRQRKYEHPYYWATFIAAGDWRPLPTGILAQPKSPP